LLRATLLPEANRYSPTTTMAASRVSAKAMLSHKPRPTTREAEPANGSFGPVD
jgi:hypothetical protein